MTVKRWAIAIGLTGKFIGPGWLRDKPPYPYCNPVALFLARKEARETLKQVKGSFRDARVVRVTVSIEAVA